MWAMIPMLRVRASGNSRMTGPPLLIVTSSSLLLVVAVDLLDESPAAEPAIRRGGAAGRLTDELRWRAAGDAVV